MPRIEVEDAELDPVGRVVVVRSGAHGGALATIGGPARRVRGGEDVDLDGVPDVLILRDFQGNVDLVSGGSGATILTFATGPVPGQRLAAIELLDDVDGDGVPDLAVGDSWFQSNLGRVRAFSGAGGGLLWTALGGTPAGRFGQDLVRRSDANGDGVTDLLASANVDLATPNQTSSVSALSGASGATVFKVFSTDSFDQFGAAMAEVGDVNGDSRPDFVIGEPAGTWSGSNQGLAYVYSSHCWDEFVDLPGCVGATGVPPTLDLVGCLTPAGAGVLQLTDVAGGAPGLLIVDTTFTSSQTIAPGCRAWVGLTGPTLPFVTFGPATPGLGVFSAYLPMPPAFAGGALVFQAFVADATAPLGFVGSNGLLTTPN